MSEIWKELSPGRERVVFALGMLNSASDESSFATIGEVYNILENLLDTCIIFEKPKDDADAE